MKTAWAVGIGFLVGVVFMQWNYRDVPVETVRYVRDDQSKYIFHTWTQTVDTAQSLALIDTEIIFFIDDLLREYDGRFNKGLPIDSDRYNDLEQLYTDREEKLKTLQDLKADFQAYQITRNGIASTQ